MITRLSLIKMYPYINHRIYSQQVRLKISFKKIQFIKSFFPCSWESVIFTLETKLGNMISFETRLSTWRHHYWLGNITFNLETWFPTWKRKWTLGNIALKLETSLFISKNHLWLRNILGFLVNKSNISKFVSKLKDIFPC